MDLHPTCRFSLKTKFDRTNPKGVHIGEETYIAFEAVILTHDRCRVRHCHTYVGRHCFIGARAIILPGVRIGDNCVVGAGSVVTKDTPPGTIVAGNPAKVIRTGIQTLPYGSMAEDMEDAVEQDRARRQKDASELAEV